MRCNYSHLFSTIGEKYKKNNFLYYIYLLFVDNNSIIRFKT